MAIINLTPHDVNIYLGEDNIITIPASGTIARLTTSTVTIGEIDGIPVTTTAFGDITGLPDPTPGTAFIVSALVAGRCTNRNDCFIPNEAIRDDKGIIIGCRSLGRV